MDNFKIKQEYAPGRCEVCHQSDLFDQVNNYCDRCSLVHMKANSIGMQQTQDVIKITRQPLDRLDKMMIAFGVATAACTGIWVILNRLFSGWHLPHLVNIFIAVITVLMLGAFIFVSVANAFRDLADKILMKRLTLVQHRRAIKK